MANERNSEGKGSKVREKKAGSGGVSRAQEMDVYRTTDKANRFDENGHEVLNPTVMAPPLGYKKQLSIAEQVRQQIRSMKALQDDEPETEEEADDFDIEDDPVMPSRWENDLIPSIKETRKRMKELEKEVKMYAKAPEAKPAQAAEPKAGPKPDKGD